MLSNLLPNLRTISVGDITLLNTFIKVIFKAFIDYMKQNLFLDTLYKSSTTSSLATFITSYQQSRKGLNMD